MTNKANQQPPRLAARLRQINLRYLLERAEGAVGRMHPYFLLDAFLVRVTCAATDLNISIVSEIEIRRDDGEEVHIGGRVCVPARKLLDLVKALPDSHIDLTLLDGHRLQVQCGDYDGIIPCVDPDAHFPLVSLPEGPADFGCDGDLIPTLHTACAHALDKRGKSAICSGLHLRTEGDVLLAAATDGHRLALAGKREMDYSAEKLSGGITLPAVALKELKDIHPGTAEIYLRDNDITFVQRGVTLHVRLLEGDYPQFRRVIPADHPHCCVVKAAELARIIERVNILSDADSVTLDINPGEGGGDGDIMVTAENAAGKSVDIVPAEIKGDPAQIRVTPGYLVDALRSLVPTSEDVVIKYCDAGSALVIIPCDHGGWDERIEVVMPRRM